GLFLAGTGTYPVGSLSRVLSCNCVHSLIQSRSSLQQRSPILATPL
ncbi:hypothetical protein AVDCRST_MAG81-2281, partial [uncultured Synechococcales cyanobacterium]